MKNYCKYKFHLAIVIIFLGLLLSMSAEGTPSAQIFIDFNETQLIYNYNGLTIINAGAHMVSEGNDWEVKQVEQYDYHMRHKDWKDYYWNLDTNLKQIYRVTEGTFGSSDGRKAVLKGVSARFEKIGSEKTKTWYIILKFPSSYLSYEPATGNLHIATEGGILSYCNDWEVKEVKNYFYHIRFKKWSKYYWKLDTENMKTYAVKDGNFGISGGNENPINLNIRTVDSDPAPSKDTGIIEDIEMSRIPEAQRPKSDWIESEKALYSNLLKHDSYDILVAPFQVQGYAIDRVGRSLMTRYLSHCIEQSTEAKMPDSTLVARALGENSRTFDEGEIYKLANELKVKTLIRGYVGHNRDEKMRLTLIVQVKGESGSFSQDTKVTSLHWQGIPFSDERPPEDTFRDLLNEIMSKLPLNKTKGIEVTVYERENQLPVPEKILDMVSKRSDSPIISAYDLQFLGMLYPEQSTDMEHLFERSLVALSPVSPKSPDYPLLKARALFYLHRRPAAVAALGEPSSPEEKAFLALLNGNLPELKKWIDEIESPIHKLMIQIELNDLNWSYEQPLSKEGYKDITERLPDWEMIITQRLQSKDEWNIQSNLEVKQKLDGVFPIPDFTAKELAIGMMALGESPLEGEDIELSVYNHYRRLLTGQRGKFCCMNGAWYPVERDYLDILAAIGESNLLKDIRLLVYNKALHEVALNKLDSLETIYNGHPKMTYLRGSALSGLWRKKQDNKLRDDLRFNAYYWFQGQVFLDYTHQFPYYDGDYPKRPFCHTEIGDRKELKGDNFFNNYVSSLPPEQKDFLKKIIQQLRSISLSLKYTHNKFYFLKSYYEDLINHKMYDDAKALMDLNKHRFIGNPMRITYLLEIEEKKGNISNLIKNYEEMVDANPESWGLYLELGKIYIKQGDFKKALATFLKYPLFKEGENRKRVEMSNYALVYAVELWRHSAVDEAIPLFRIAANSNTGSGAEMASSGILAILNGDYPKAAFHFLELIKRYDNTEGYREYMTLLHLMGYHKESWAIFNTIDIQSNSPDIWPAAFIGHRMESKSEEEIIQWLLQKDLHAITSDHIERYILMSHLIDRPTNKELSDIIEETIKKFKPPPNKFTVEGKSRLAWFAEGYYYIRKGDIPKAFEIFKKEYNYSSKRYGNNFALPYFVWSGTKDKKTSEIENLFKSAEGEYGDLFEVHLSKAFFYGLQGDHQKAIYHLKNALYRIPSTGSLPIFPWYQLVEACEWLYDDTGYEEYRKLALEWAKIHQRFNPAFAWAYAVEAKYTDSATDRMRALALTLYLDSRSEHIVKFSDSDKKEALDWLAKNNPFQKRVEKQIPEFPF